MWRLESILSYLPMLISLLLLLKGTDAGWSNWKSWGPCSASCDHGTQVRHRVCERSRQLNVTCTGSSNEERPCHEYVCPSYLAWPRIHFFGKFHVNDPTANNMRCFFDNDRFCPTCGTYRQFMAVNMHNMKYNSSYVKHMPVSANPMGNGHFHFLGTRVTSVCWNPDKKCVKKSGLRGRLVGGRHHARMVDLDPDWQNAPEVIGYKFNLDGVFNARMLNTAIIKTTVRIAGYGDTAMSPALKSKLVDIEWLDPYYEKKFNMAKNLSINFIIDAFNYTLLTGRLTGTIGMTSSDDPVNNFGGRVMKPFRMTEDNQWEVPFHVSRKHKKVVMDLSVMVKSDEKGNFSHSTLKHVDVAMVTSPTRFPDDSDFYLSRFVLCGGQQMFLLTKNGALDLVKNLTWYEFYGGIVEVSLDDASDELIRIVSNSRLAIVNRSTTHGEMMFKSKKLTYTLCDLLPNDCWFFNANRDAKCHLVALESEQGLNFKPMGRFTNRLGRGQSWEIPTQVTSFGRPLQGATAQLRLLERSVHQATCHPDNPCSPYLSWPKEPLKLSGVVTTDHHGMANLSVKVMRNIGHPRKCGMDGQIYPMGIIVEHTDKHNNTVKIGDGGMFIAYSPYLKLLKECGLEKGYVSFALAVKVFSSLPSSVMKKTCPSWEEDIRPIFQFYYNMFPVMAKHDIINLRSIQSVRSKIHLINMSMFEYDWNHPNFMPTTRDLSPDKTEIVRRWIECEVNGAPKTEQPKPNKLEIARESICGNAEQLKKTMTSLHENLQTAMLVELYTIPPYLTALFSLKRDRFKLASKLLKSISTEEMLHMSLASNILNSIGGKPNLTNADWIPFYPTPFRSRDFYEIRPDLMLSLEPYSTSLIKEVFSEIEKPAPKQIIDVLNSIALLWHVLPQDEGGRWRKNETKENKQYSDIYFDDDEEDFVTENGGPLWYDVATRISKTNKFNKSNSTSVWSKAFRYSTSLLEKPYIADVYSIGGYYAHVMLQLIQAEACVKINSTSQTIFTGDPHRQLTHRQWYVTRRRSSAILFPVRGIRSALEAAFEIVYEGEGGSPCSPFVTSPRRSSELFESLAAREELSNPYATEVSPNFEKSHFVKFQELVHGRELVAVRGNPPDWSDAECLPANLEQCGCSEANSTTCWRFCFSGRSVSFEGGLKDVWPIRTLTYESPAIMNMPNIPLNKRTAVLSKQFDVLYTEMLTLLERTMNGEIGLMPTCMGKMYELLDAGKKLVTQPLYENGDPNVGPTAAPMWKFLKGSFELDGQMTYGTPHGGHVKLC